MADPIRHDEILSSRFFRIDDAFVEKYWLWPKRFRRPLYWNLLRRGAWSRMYEYPWILESIRVHFDGMLDRTTVLDAGCGIDNPLCFKLAEMGCRVDAQDLFDIHPTIQQLNWPNLRYMKGNLKDPIPQRYAAVICVSTVEHIPPSIQPAVIHNLCDAVRPGGVLLMTFDCPGFEYDTDLGLYRQILRARKFEFSETETPEAARLSSRNGRLYNPGWPDIQAGPQRGRDVLYVYRILAVRVE